jgi:YidC/Oxa1 family membrane protein insertase
MMDKKTFLIVTVCLAGLLGWNWLVGYLYPPVPKAARPPVLLAQTNVVVTTPVATKIEAAPVTQLPPPTKDRPAEQVVTLQNDFVRVEVTSWGGGIKSVELLKHKASGPGHVVLNGPDFAPALALKDDFSAYELQQISPREVVLRHGPVTKRLTLGNDYLFTGSIEISGAATQAVAVVVGTAVPANLQKETADFLGVDWIAQTKYQNRGLKQAQKGPGHEAVPATWVAVKSQFFAMVLTPATNLAAVSYAPAGVPPPVGWKEKEPPQGLTAVAELPARADGRYEFTFYAGPKEYRRLAALGKVQEDVMQFGMWSVISVVLLQSMNFCYRLIPNYGVAIILITIAIKIVFWPIQAKSIKSMKAMQKFQPMMAKLKEKYGDDKQKLNTEMMKLYKEHKINPLSGCLPMLVQIPVFFALFAMLRSAIELRGTAFLWVKDLSQPDTIFHIAGLPVNPLPLIMTGSMVWQQKITPTTGDPQQAKMMMFMPLMMLFFFYTSSSGLALYWTVQQLLSIGQQWWSLRQKEPDVVIIPPGRA